MDVRIYSRRAAILLSSIFLSTPYTGFRTVRPRNVCDSEKTMAEAIECWQTLAIVPAAQSTAHQLRSPLISIPGVHGRRNISEKKEGPLIDADGHRFAFSVNHICVNLCSSVGKASRAFSSADVANHLQRRKNLESASPDPQRPRCPIISSVDGTEANH